MNIIATGDGWAFSMLGSGSFKYGIDKKTGALSVAIDPKAKHKRDILMVEVASGIFIETVEDGKVVQSGGDGERYHVQLRKAPVTLRYKTLPDPKLSASTINKARKKVTRWLVDDQPYGAGVPDTLVGLIKWSKKLLTKIPQKSRKKARCSFDTSTSYGETYPHVEVSYEEAETDAEVIARVKIERERARIIEFRKREQLAKLKSELE